MEIKPAIRSEIEKHMRTKGYSLSKLSALTGINSGHLSEILNGNPPRAITIRQLDAIAAAFGYEPGWLYDLYPEECATVERISRPRVIPYLIRCAELGRDDLIEQVVAVLMENPKNVSILFSVGEQLYEAGKREESALFYRLVIDNEKDNHSDQYLISQYRLFRASLGTDIEQNWKAVIRFEPYRNRLPDGYRLDGLLQLANTCFTLRKWKEMEQYADELRDLATVVYQNELRKKKRKRPSEHLQTERHLVVYYGQGYLLKSVALQQQGLYHQAKQYIDGYADLGWFELLDELGQIEVDKFRLFATANSYYMHVCMGNSDVLPDYVRFLADHPNELLAGLAVIVESAVRYGFSIDNILDRFADEISHFHERQNPYDLERYYRFRYWLAKYQIENGQCTTGLEQLVLERQIFFKEDIVRLSEWLNHQLATARRNTAEPKTTVNTRTKVLDR
ncbi:helix-turn-helix transcriptional regulator [Brevibacillus humidisoli]|uniref:helix-turn-helix domain-containing protein n=1 Tax=Brevibacillus humidisoli TaxID=2895522 RepID=UPI001E46CE91|nr:helix-turn-helix transcriptional regulator [Brevibacillus humidisoli]UFJ41483.1 helix-turn-helix transcriptional regulator [Brevibacillus humidisoli]